MVNNHKQKNYKVTKNYFFINVSSTIPSGLYYRS